MDNEFHDKIDIEEFPTTHAYTPPAQKSVQEILDSDTNDESLKKYKESLLGGGAGKEIVIDPNNYSNVLLKKLSIMVDDKEMRSTTLPTPDEFVLSIKEGCIYKIQLEFQVQREIITGLKYLHKISRIGVGVAKENWMLGSYGPREEPYIYVSPPEEAPSGMLSRGKYKVRSLVADDDENRYLEWTWYIEISKDW